MCYVLSSDFSIVLNNKNPTNGNKLFAQNSVTTQLHDQK